MRQGGYLKPGPPDPARQGGALLEVPLRLVGSKRPELGGTEGYQRHSAHLFALSGLRGVRDFGGGKQPLRLLDHGREVTASLGQEQPQGDQLDLEAPAPVRRHRRHPPDRLRQILLRRLQGPPQQLVGGYQRGQLRIGGDHAGRESGQQLVRRGALPVQDKALHMVRQQPGGQAPVLRRLGVPDRLHREPMVREPAGGRAVQRKELTRRAAPQLQLQQVGEQLVVAEPEPPHIHRDHERAGLL